MWLAWFALAGHGVAQNYQPLALVFHQVGTPAQLTVAVSPAELRDRVLTLQGLGYRFVTSRHLKQARRGARLAVIQFDDGFESVYQRAFPVLRELGVPGTAYVIWSKVGQPGFMTLEELRELQAAGWEIGHHTLSHAALTDLTPQGLRRELAAAPLEGVECVSYPLNRQDARVRRAARGMGLPCGVSGGPVGLGPLEAEALPAPAITPWDEVLLPFRARYGVDARVPMLFIGGLLPVLDGIGGVHPLAPAPVNWNPAGFELLGNGAFQALWRGGDARETQLDLRARRAALHVLTRRGADGMNGHYNAASLAYSIAPFTLAAGLDSGGPLVGGALALGGYGEVWGRVNRVANHWAGAWGAVLIPADYWQVYGAQSFQQTGTQGVLGLRTALPWMTSEARPLRVGAGYRWGREDVAFGDLEYRFGSYALGAEIDTKRRFGVRFSAVW